MRDTAPSLYPGRMAPNTATAFLCLDGALLLFLLGARAHHRVRVKVAGLLASLTALLGLFGVTGYIGDISIGYGWGNLTTMAPHTAAMFSTLGFVALLRAWDAAGLQIAIGRRVVALFALGLAIFVAMGAVS